MTNKKGTAQNRTAFEMGSEITEAMDQEFHEAPDRVLAIVGAAYLDSLIEELFRAIFSGDREEADRLLAADRPLGSNGSRYQLAFCLGLIEREERDDPKMIAKIRNAFPHGYDVRSFDHDEPRKLLARLHSTREFETILKQLVEETNDADQQQLIRTIGMRGRLKFQETVRDLFVRLLRRLYLATRPDRSTSYKGHPD